MKERDLVIHLVRAWPKVERALEVNPSPTLKRRPPDGAPRLMLHARALQLTHPVTGQRLELASAVPF